MEGCGVESSHPVSGYGSGFCEHFDGSSGFISDEELLGQLCDNQRLSMDSALWSE